MRAILINIGLIPVLLVVIPLILLLSLMPRADGMQRFRSQIMNWLDQITNDYGAELIYLAGPVASEDAEAVPNNASSTLGAHATARTNLIIVPFPSPTAQPRRTSPSCSHTRGDPVSVQDR